MKVIYYPTDSLSLPPLSVALGFFDGVHIGHRRLIEKTIKIAKEKGLAPAVFTFPAESAGLKSSSARLYSTLEKLLIFEELGVEYTIIADFSAVVDFTAKEFVRRVLVNELNTEVALSGYNFHFGRGAKGDASLLTELMSEAGGEAIILDEQRADGKPVSTSIIRGLLSEGRLAEANRLLGSPYRQRALVERGLGLGRTMGFPTVNTEVTYTPLPRGVYASVVKMDEKCYTGVTNLGICPTFEERELHLETLIVDYSGDAYDRSICIYFIEKLRDEQVFESPEALRKQVYLDREKAIAIVRNIKWQEIGLN